MDAHYLTYGNTLTPLGVRLKQEDSDGDLQDVDLSGLTVKVILTDENGTVVVAETTIGITVVSATLGKVQYDFQTALPVGEYLIWFNVYLGAEFDTYPVSPDELRIIVTNPIAS